MENNIQYYKKIYTTVLCDMVKNNKNNIKKINEEMWLIECEETGDTENPFCLYYHERGIVSGFSVFRDNVTFLIACENLLRQSWGIKAEPVCLVQEEEIITNVDEALDYLFRHCDDKLTEEEKKS